MFLGGFNPYKLEVVFAPDVSVNRYFPLTFVKMLANNFYVIKPTHCKLLLLRKTKSVDLNKHSGEQQIGQGFSTKPPFDKAHR